MTTKNNGADGSTRSPLGRARGVQWHEPMQRWLFIGTLLVATLAIPAVAVVSRAAAIGGAELRAEAASTLAMPSRKVGARAKPSTPASGGSARAPAPSCAPSLFGSDVMLVRECPLKP